jgi:hypothetical protein
MEEHWVQFSTKQKKYFAINLQKNKHHQTMVPQTLDVEQGCPK